jgi:HD-like signal output (HDOD) protein/class 3 adenylate cyclase
MDIIMGENKIQRRLSAVLCADVKGYSKLMGTNDEFTVTTITKYREIVADLIERYQGRVVDSPGDNILAEFSSALHSVKSAIEIQSTLDVENSKLPPNRRMHFRIGVNLGDILHQDGRIYGDGVNIAARIESMADPGGVFISRSVYNQIKKKITQGIESLGKHHVKNIAEPVWVYRILVGTDNTAHKIGAPLSKTTSFLTIFKSFLTNNKAVLPVFNSTGLKIQQEASKTEPDISVIENMIACDQSLTGHILRMANSAYYGGLQKTTTVRSAIVRLGSQEVANIAMMASQKRLFKSKNAFIQTVMRELWNHSVGTAIASQWIANRTGNKEKAPDAFTAGLLHDIGKLFILTVTDAVKQHGAFKQMPSESLLKEVMETYHTRYGHTLLRSWNLPEHYCHIARDHHKENTESNSDLLKIVLLANQKTNSMGIGHKGVKACVLAATPEAEYFGLSEIDLAELEIKLENVEVLSR